MGETSIHSGHRERLRQRFISSGFKDFSEHEILEMLLFYSIPRKDTNELSHQLINKFGSLSRIFDANADELSDAGASENTVVFLRLVTKLIQNYVSTKKCEPNQKYTISRLKNKCITTFLTPGMGNFAVSLHNAKNIEVFFETVDTSVEDIDKRLIETTMKYHAVSAVIAIKRDNGVVFPTMDDIDTALRFKNNLSRVNVRLNDFLIVSDKECFSFAEDSETITVFN